MSKKIILLLCYIFLTNVCFALDIDVDMWSDFEGKLGKTAIKLSIFRFENGIIKGNYCYKKYEEKILLIGKIKGNNIELKEIVEGKTKGLFRGTVSTNGPDLFEGTWSHDAQILSFKLSLSSICGGGYEHRYSDFDGKDIDVENFMKKVKFAILNNDKEWMADNIYFPIQVHINRKNTLIKTKKQFMKNFDNIFYQQFKNEIKSFCVCNMFNNYNGVMLGNGAIWINPDGGSSYCKITSINNYKIF
jgi:hypothetical protein